jgi:hypothetical protein
MKGTALQNALSGGPLADVHSALFWFLLRKVYAKSERLRAKSWFRLLSSPDSSDQQIPRSRAV